MHPSTWAEATIEDVADYVQRGKSPKYAPSSPLPVVNQKCIRWHGIDEQHLKFVDPSQWDAWGDERYLRAGDILWNSTGTGTIGRAALFCGLKISEKAVADSHVTVVRPSLAIDSRYLHRLIQSPLVQSKIEDMQNGSTNQVELSRDEVLGTSVPLPPLSEQRRIVAKIDSLSEKSKRARDRLDHVPRLVARYKEAVVASAFRGELTARWRLAHSGSVSLAEIDKRRRGGWDKAYSAKIVRGRYPEPQDIDWQPVHDVPSEWAWVSLDRLVSLIQYGSSAKTSEDPSGVPVLRMGNIQNGTLDWRSLKFLPSNHDEFPELLLASGDVLFNRTNSAELVGKTAVFDGSRAASFASYLIRLRPTGLDPRLLSAYLNSSLGREWIASVVSQQVGQANVNGTSSGSLACR